MCECLMDLTINVRYNENSVHSIFITVRFKLCRVQLPNLFDFLYGLLIKRYTLLIDLTISSLPLGLRWFLLCLFVDIDHLVQLLSSLLS